MTAPTPDTDLMATVREVALGYGLSQGTDGLHSWRCDYPDIYGECDCLDEFVTDMSRTLTDLIHEREVAAAQAALREFADQLQLRRQHEITEGEYWRGDRPRRWNMHYWRAEALERAIKAARDKARRLAPKREGDNK